MIEVPRISLHLPSRKEAAISAVVAVAAFVALELLSRFLFAA